MRSLLIGVSLLALAAPAAYAQGADVPTDVVSGPVEPGSAVTLHNPTATDVTLTADDGSFDVVVPGRTLGTFTAPDEPGEYGFSSRHSASFADVLVVN